MAEKAFTLEVITPDRMVLSDGRVTSVVAPGIEGYLGVLANHAPLMTELAVGRLHLDRSGDATDAMAVSGGFMEVFENKVTVLAESAEMAGEIDVSRAEEAVRRAEERLASQAPGVDIERAKASLQRAINRLNVAQNR